MTDKSRDERDPSIYAPGRALPVDADERVGPLQRFRLPAELEAQARRAERARPPRRPGDRARPQWSKPPLERRPEWRPLYDWLCLAALRGVHRGKQKLREDKANHVINLVQKVQGWAYKQGNGEGYTTWEQLIVALYSDEKRNRHADPGRAFQTSVWRWARWAREAGLLELTEVTDPLTGASVCLRWRLLDPLVDSIDPAGVAQSVEATRTHGGRVRRKETLKQRQERSHRRWCRSTGRGTIGRLDTRVARSHFRSEDLGTPGCPSPRSSEKGDLRARRASAREAGPAPPAWRTAGTERRRVRTEANELYRACRARLWAPPEAVLRGFGGLARLDRLAQAGPVLEQATRDGTHPAAVGLVAMDLAFDRATPPILTDRAIERIARHAATLDRCAGRSGAGALELLALIVEHAEQVKAQRAVRPGALGWFAMPLRRAARRAARQARPAAAERVRRRRERRRHREVGP